MRNLQTLKFLFDTTVSSERDGIYRVLLKRDADQKIDPTQWLYALRYGEGRFRSVEHAVALVALRLRDLAQNVLTHKPFNAADSISTAKIGVYRPQASDQGEFSLRNKEKLIIAFGSLIVAFVDKKVERHNCEKALGDWLEEARRDGRIK